MKCKTHGILQKALQYAKQGTATNKDHLYDEFKEGLYCAYKDMEDQIEMLIKDCKE